MNTRVHTSIDKGDDGNGQCWCKKNNHVGFGLPITSITAEILDYEITVITEAVPCTRILCSMAILDCDIGHAYENPEGGESETHCQLEYFPTQFYILSRNRTT
jgi:hypothetical protein